MTVTLLSHAHNYSCAHTYSSSHTRIHITYYTPYHTHYTLFIPYTYTDNTWHKPCGKVHCTSDQQAMPKNSSWQELHRFSLTVGNSSTGLLLNDRWLRSELAWNKPSRSVNIIARLDRIPIVLSTMVLSFMFINDCGYVLCVCVCVSSLMSVVMILYLCIFKIWCRTP